MGPRLKWPKPKTYFVCYLTSDSKPESGIFTSLFLSTAFRLNCSVDESGLITIDCQEVDGEIDSEQLYCIYDNGPRESCMATVSYRLPYSSRKISAP